MNLQCRVTASCALAIAALIAPSIEATPIAFAQGTTVMGEYGADAMRELQVFYSPRYFYATLATWFVTRTALHRRDS